MIFSRSAEYAIRALVELGSLPSGESAVVKKIAADAGVPSYFVAKLLQDLVREGLLKSNKGPRGGFRLAGPASELPILKVIEAVDGEGKYDRCIAGQAECNDHAACPMHDSWMPLRSRIVEYLQGTSIADLAKSLGEKRRPPGRSRRRR